ncbi:MAG TPA: TQO small subunit DoxD [Actinomycetota bacterium]
MNATKTRARRPEKLLPPPPSSRGRHRGASPLLDEWREQPVSLRLLRAFLGVTFVYAGIQKMADPYFLHAGSPDFIGNQLVSFAQGSPIGGILRMLAHAPVLTGLAIAFAEIAIGLGTLVGIAPLAVAAGGFLVNLTLTLSATWHVHPYFLGSDSMYAVAWLAYLLGLVEIRRRSHAGFGPSAGRRPSSAPGEVGRREFIRGGALAGATLLVASAGAAFAGKPAQALRAGGGTSSGHRSGGGGSSPSQAPQGPTASGGSTQGTPIATLSSIPVGGAIGFNDPGVGPAALVRLGQNDVVAYSRVCTHAGCLVGYDQSQRILYCPCHGAEYDPAQNAQVIAGPAPRPLAPIQVEIDKATGQVVLPS